MTTIGADAEQERQLRTTLSRYRAIAIPLVSIVGMLMIGAVLGAIAGGDRVLLQEIAGLIGAAAIIFSLCLALVGVLWLVLVLTSR